MKEDVTFPGAAMSKTYSTPRRFDLATLMAVVVAYMLLFGLMRAAYLFPLSQKPLDAGPFFWFAGLITAVGVSQAVFIRRNPRLVSIACGIVFCFVTFMGDFALHVLTTGRLDYYVAPFVAIIVGFLTLLAGCVGGYVSGVGVGGVFLVADYLRRWLGWQPVEEQAIESQPQPIEAELIAGEGATIDVSVTPTHPLDQTGP